MKIKWHFLLIAVWPDFREDIIDTAID